MESWVSRNLDANDFFEDYIQTYLERDLKQILNVSNLRDFRRFLTLLALRVGQLVNFAELSKRGRRFKEYNKSLGKRT